MFGASSELASVMEFGFYRSLASQSLRRGPSVILAQTCRCGRTSNERRRGASLLSVNCARSAPSVADSHVPDACSGSGTLTTRLYDNAVLVGIPAYLIRRLQSVLNAAARFIYPARPHDHISEALVILHRLRGPERVQS